MMNPGQEKFLNFILERVQEGKENEAKALLNESFDRQDNGTFTPEFAAGFAPRMLGILKPEHVEEVKNIMTQFRG